MGFEDLRGGTIDALAARLKVTRCGDSISVVIPMRKTQRIAWLALILSCAFIRGWIGLAMDGQFFGLVETFVWLLVGLYWWANLEDETLQLNSRGLKHHPGIWMHQRDRFYQWLPLKNVRLSPPSRWGPDGIHFEYEKAPYLGCRFMVGANLTGSETPYLLALIQYCRARALTQELPELYSASLQ